VKQLSTFFFFFLVFQNTLFAELTQNPRYTYGQSVSCGAQGRASRPKLLPPVHELPSGAKGPVQALGLMAYSARLTDNFQKIEISIGLAMRSCIKDHETGEEFFYTELSDPKDYLLLKAYHGAFSDVQFRQNFINLARVDMNTGFVTHTPNAKIVLDINQLLNSKMKAAFERNELVQLNLSVHYGFENFESDVRAYFPYANLQTRVYEEDLSNTYVYRAFHGLKLSLQKNQVKLETIKP
jgi:hypothetical protein